MENVKQKLSEIEKQGWPSSAPAVSGVYAIVNSQNGRAYIGSSANTKARLHQHLSLMKSGKHHNKALLDDVALMGVDSMSAGVLIECEAEDRLVFEYRAINQLSENERYNRVVITEERAQLFKARPPGSVIYEASIPCPQLEKLSLLSVKTGEIVPMIIRRAIEAFLKKEQK